jgi:predicted PurR-regulated permease PerM
VILLYSGIQGVESYLVTPLVQQRTIFSPPALILTAQMLMGVLLGGIGIILAVPLFAVIQVLVKMLYIEDTLGERK